MGVVEKCKAMLSKSPPEMVRDAAWSTLEIEILNRHLFHTSKPVVYLANIGDTQYVKK